MTIGPYIPDNTRMWVEHFGRDDGKLKPNLLVRVATDTNYIRVAERDMYGVNGARTKSVMNVALPGQQITGIQSWTVQESADQIVQTATMELLNCLQISQIETTTITALEGLPHSSTITAQWVTDSLGVSRKITAASPASGGSWPDPTAFQDPTGYHYREENVEFRLFQHQAVGVANATAFPNPAIPDDDDNDVDAVAQYPAATDGVGAYYILIGNEIVRVDALTTGVFSIPPGGRGVAGTPIVHHPIGTRVRLLGFGPWTGEWTGAGYLSVDDYKPQMAALRPGTCLVSYEGWGEFTAPMRHEYDPNKNYVFTGYWFVTGLEPSIAEDGVPKIRVDLKSAGTMLEQQKISPDVLRRAKTRFGEWRIGQAQQTIWGAADHDRNIPGDWVDYNSWDPSLPNSYPLKIKVELAQHKEFYDHMMSTEYGYKCEICRAEQAEWRKSHKPDPLAEQRAVGRHIYKQSIRVLQEPAGPIKTYIRLLSTIAMAAWDHPALGTELAQAFSKIPNTLFDNMRHIHSGLIFNGQIDLQLLSQDPDFDWFSPTYSDEQIISARTALKCPFESTYDKTGFSQPMFDLADTNNCSFWITREGYPVFKPRLFSFRPSGHGKTTKGVPLAPLERQQNSQWFMAYGGSISGYSHSLNPEAIVTQAWVTGTTAFGSSLTVLAGGTGIRGDGSRVKYSGLGGNRDGLGLTSGVQQVETLSTDSLMLGLDWNTNPVAWGAIEERDGNNRVLNAIPTLYDGSPVLSAGSQEAARAPLSVKRIQRTVNFFLVRRLFSVADDPKLIELKVDGKYGKDTTNGVKALQVFLNANVTPNPGITTSGNYGRNTYTAIKKYLEINKHYIQFDIFWYVANRDTMGWEKYLSAITGVPIVTKTNPKDNEPVAAAYQSISTQTAVGEWTKGFSKDLVNIGNKKVDDSLDKATVRTITSNIADPRIQPGDTIWAVVPGHLGQPDRPPFTNGIYVLTVQRTFDLTVGSYTAQYSGHRFLGDFNQGLGKEAVNAGYDYIR